jgi:hypothetical protein
VLLNSEMAWRKALEARGRDRVMAELQARGGQPNDIVLDLVFEDPYPTREFCLRWCAEQDNRIFHLSGHAIAVIIALVIFLAVGAKAVVSWNNDAGVRQSSMQHHMRSSSD